MKTCEERTAFSFIINGSDAPFVNCIRQELQNNLGDVGIHWRFIWGYHPDFDQFITALVVYDENDAMMIRLKYGLKPITLDPAQT